jgi:beta-carotene hydroxylase
LELTLKIYYCFLKHTLGIYSKSRRFTISYLAFIVCRLETHISNRKPSIKDLGIDLLTLSRFQLVSTFLIPFSFFFLYFVFAFNGLWIFAVLCTIGLSFTSYGSTSHDLVHENLKIHRHLNTFLLSLLELICFRSGHAYRLSHLYHHRRFPNEDDVEGAASRMTFIRTLLEGMIFQFKIFFWTVNQNKNSRHFHLIMFEGIGILIFVLCCFISLSYTWVLFVYMIVMIAGSWIIPLITSYAVHIPSGSNELQQTRLFRGRFFSIVAFDHLYHLEHHLYPMVPHKNWPKLARRLDTYFKAENIKPVEIKL